MLQIKVQCPNASCGKVLLVDSGLAGKKGKCSTCGTVFPIPAVVSKPSAGASQPAGAKPSRAPRPAAGAPRPAPAGRTPQAAGRKPAKPHSDAQRSAPKRKPTPVETPRDDDLLADALLEEDDAFGSPRLPVPQLPRLARRAAPPEDDDDDYEDYEDYEAGGSTASGDFEDYEEYDDDDRPVPRTRPRKSRGGLSPKQGWRRASIGMRIAAIAMCVYAGAYGINMIGEFLFEIGYLTMTSAITEAQGGSRDAYFAARESAQSGISMMMSSVDVFRVARLLLAAAAVALVVGYVFGVFAPNREGALPLAIAALSVAGVALVLDIAFRTVPFLSTARMVKLPYDTTLQVITLGAAIAMGGLAGPRTGPASQGIIQNIALGDRLLALLIELLTVAALVLYALFLAAAARAHKERVHSRDCLKIVWALCGYGAIMVLLYVFLGVRWGPGSDWVAYLVWAMHWAANAVLMFGLVLFIKNAFYSARTTG